jgi:hypothetical protein
MSLQEGSWVLLHPVIHTESNGHKKGDMDNLVKLCDASAQYIVIIINIKFEVIVQTLKHAESNTIKEQVDDSRAEWSDSRLTVRL